MSRCLFCNEECNLLSQACDRCTRTSFSRYYLEKYIDIKMIEHSIIDTLDKSIDSDKMDRSIVIYDIDETLIDGQGNPREHILRTYNYALTKGYKIAIITARPGSVENINYTREQLTKAGIRDYEIMFFRPEHYKDIATYKLKCRKHLHELEYNIVASIGDAYWDIGEYGGVGFIV